MHHTITRNADNEYVMPWVGHGMIMGYVDEVNGAGAKEVSGFLPTRHELIVLVKYWAERMLDDKYLSFVMGGTGSTEIRRRPFARRRIQRIQELLGAGDVSKAIEEVHEEYKEKYSIDSEEWSIFTSGDKAEWERFQAGVQQASQLIENPPDSQSPLSGPEVSSSTGAIRT